jgi:hypothetical protein
VDLRSGSLVRPGSDVCSVRPGRFSLYALRGGAT